MDFATQHEVFCSGNVFSSFGMEQNIMDFATQHEVFCSGNVFSHLGWSKTSWTLPHNTRFSAQVMLLVIWDGAKYHGLCHTTRGVLLR
jgi:hypothetical protein